MRLAVIGIGLMGGSLALSLKKKGFVSNVIGVDNNLNHQTEALRLGIVDEIMTLEDAVKLSDIIAIATPVNKGILELKFTLHSSTKLRNAEL